MILVSGSIADFSRTLEAAWLAVCGHHVLFGSRSGQTHSLAYTHARAHAHAHTHACPVLLIPDHVTQQTWDQVALPASETVSPCTVEVVARTSHGGTSEAPRHLRPFSPVSQVKQTVAFSC